MRIGFICLQFVLRDFGLFREVAQQAGLERLVSMHRNRQSYDRSLATIDMVTAMDSQQSPTVPLHNATEVFSRRLFQTAISMTRADFSLEG